MDDPAAGAVVVELRFPLDRPEQHATRVLAIPDTAGAFGHPATKMTLAPTTSLLLGSDLRDDGRVVKFYAVIHSHRRMLRLRVFTIAQGIVAPHPDGRPAQRQSAAPYERRVAGEWCY